MKKDNSLKMSKQKKIKLFDKEAIKIFSVLGIISLFGIAMATYSTVLANKVLSGISTTTTSKDNINTSSSNSSSVNSNSTEQNSNKDQIFVDKKNGFSFHYPLDWTYNTTADLYPNIEGTVSVRFYSSGLKSGYFNYAVDNKFTNVENYISYIRSQKQYSNYFTSFVKKSENGLTYYETTVSISGTKVVFFKSQNSKIIGINFSPTMSQEIISLIINSININV